MLCQTFNTLRWIIINSGGTRERVLTPSLDILLVQKKMIYANMNLLKGGDVTENVFLCTSHSVILILSGYLSNLFLDSLLISTFKKVAEILKDQRLYAVHASDRPPPLPRK